MAEGWRGTVGETVREIDGNREWADRRAKETNHGQAKSRLTALRHHDVGGPLVQGGNDGDGPAFGPTLLRPSCLLALATACICCLHAKGCGDGKKSLVARTRTV